MRKLVAIVLGVATAALATSSLAADGPVLTKIEKEGVVRIGHREASVPFSYLDNDRKTIGYSIDLCLEIVSEIKKEIGGKDIKVEYVPVTPQTRIALVANGTVDLECGSTTNNLQRQKQVAFSPVIFVTGTRLLVPGKSKVAQVEDLNGQVVAVAQGAANEKAVADAAAAAKINIKFLYVKDIAEGLLAVKTNRADALASDDILLFGLIHKAGTPDEYKVIGRLLSYEPYGIMMRRDDPAFQLVVRTKLAELYRTKKVDQIYDKWFKPIGVPMSEQFRAARELEGLN